MQAKSPDEQRQRLAIALKRQSRNPGGRVWRVLLERMLAPRRNRTAINLTALQRNFEKGRIMVVPGKVLANGVIQDKLQVAALAFSAKARTKIETRGGKCLSLEELMQTNPTGKDLKMVA
jgi:large subunit ribosomal protein L18e